MGEEEIEYSMLAFIEVTVVAMNTTTKKKKERKSNSWRKGLISLIPPYHSSQRKEVGEESQTEQKLEAATNTMATEGWRGAGFF